MFYAHIYSTFFFFLLAFEFSSYPVKLCLERVLVVITVNIWKERVLNHMIFLGLHNQTGLVLVHALWRFAFEFLDSSVVFWNVTSDLSVFIFSYLSYLTWVVVSFFSQCIVHPSIQLSQHHRQLSQVTHHFKSISFLLLESKALFHFEKGSPSLIWKTHFLMHMFILSLIIFLQWLKCLFCLWGAGCVSCHIFA